MSMTRRIFSRWMSAAPIVVGLAGDQGKVLPTERGIIRNSLLPTTLAEPPIREPAGLKEYYAARNAAASANRYKSLLGKACKDAHFVGVPPSIDCLRSVSRSHKYHMMAKRVLKEQEAERTIAEMLLDQFGVRDWFMGRGVCDDSTA